MKFDGVLAKKVGLGVVAFYALYLACVGIAATETPSQYKPEPLPVDATDKDRAQVMANGVTYAINQELNTLFGWQPNDLFLVPSILDNKTAFQKGIIYATRPASDIVANKISRFGDRDTLDSRLNDATTRYFAYSDTVFGFWFVYDSENKYKEGIKKWNEWAANVGSNNPKTAGVYNLKSDDVYNIVKYCIDMTDYALGTLNSQEISHFDSDNVIYFAKGISAVVGNVLRALCVADASIIERGGAENLQEALRRFDYINEFQPTYVLAGGNLIGDALIPNHVASLSRHLDIAMSRLTDMLETMEK